MLSCLKAQGGGGGVLLKCKILKYAKEIITQRLLFYNVVMFESTVWEGVLLKCKTLRYDKEIITQK